VAAESRHTDGMGGTMSVPVSHTDPVFGPPYECALCPRLRQFVLEHRAAEPGWHNGPVMSFGDPEAALLIVGLAPGLRGANRTGRPFTGDYAGDLLYATLEKFGWSSGRYDRAPDDGLVLRNVLITNAVRCVPPQNKPTGAEIRTCGQFLNGLVARMKHVRAILALGRIAHDAVLTSLALRKKDFAFGHAARHDVAPGLALFDSYHCSRYNTNTGRLTPEMFERVFQDISDCLAEPARF